jgi:hypothetical protein
MPTAAPLLAAALAATGSMELAVRSEVKGISGGPAGSPFSEPVPYEIDPSLSLAVEEAQRYGVRLGFSSRILFLAVPGTSAAHYGTGSAQATWRPDDRLRLDVTGVFARGVLVTPTAQLRRRAPHGGAERRHPGHSGRGRRPQGSSRCATAAFTISRALELGAAGAYAHAGGLTPVARTFFPEQEGEWVEAHLAAGASARDTLVFRTRFQRTVVFSFGTGDILDVGVRWDRKLAPDLTAYAGAGVASTVHSSLEHDLAPEARPLTPERTALELEAGIGQRPPLDRPGMGGSLALAYAPYVDPYSVAVQRRATAMAELDWLASQTMRLTGRLAAASLLRDYLPRGGAAAAEVVVWLRRPEIEMGVGSRAGYSEVPGAAYWQWSFFFSGRQITKSAL